MVGYTSCRDFPPPTASGVNVSRTGLGEDLLPTPAAFARINHAGCAHAAARGRGHLGVKLLHASGRAARKSCGRVAARIVSIPTSWLPRPRDPPGHVVPPLKSAHPPPGKPQRP